MTQRTTPSNPQPLGNVRNENRNQNNMKGEGNNRNNFERSDCNGEPGMSGSTNTPVAEPRYHNPSSMVWLIGHANQAVVVVDGVEMMALVETGSQISVLTKEFCTEFGLRILPLRGLLQLEGMEGVPVPYNGYVEANLTVPGLPQYNEDVLFLVILDHKYGQRVSVQIGTKVIDHLVVTMTREEFQQAGHK